MTIDPDPSHFLHSGISFLPAFIGRQFTVASMPVCVHMQAAALLAFLGRVFNH